MIVIYVENLTPIACDLTRDFREPDYHNTMDYAEGRVPPRYPVPAIWYKGGGFHRDEDCPVFK